MQTSINNPYRIRVSFLISILLFFTWPLWCQLELNDLTSIPDSEGPLEIRFGYNLLNITDINEKEETVDLDAAIFLRWKDERLAYQSKDSLSRAIDYSRTPEHVYQGSFRVNELYEGWRPFYYIPNGVGNRTVSNQSISIWPDGTVEYAEIFQVKVESPMDMRLYPFDKQNLVIFFHPSSYSRKELILVPDKSLSTTWVQNMGIAEWERTGDDIEEHAIDLQVHDGSINTVSEVRISLEVDRKSMHVLFSILFPMILLVSLTWIVFWLDKQSVNDRISILFIGILSVVAYYFVIQDGIPKISYLTLIDVFVIENFLILAASVIVTLIIGKLDQAGKVATGNKLDRICRWAFPTSYFVIAIIVYIGFSLSF